MDVKEFARLGGKARWKNISPKKRSEMMSELAKKRANKPSEGLSTDES